MRSVVLAVSLAVTMTTAASAGDNRAYTYQADFLAKGGNIIDILQAGSSNTAGLGSYELDRVRQYGVNNSALITQTGTGNIVGSALRPNGSTAYGSWQVGGGNSVELLQEGNANRIVYSQLGSTNSIMGQQTGVSNNAVVRQGLADITAPGAASSGNIADFIQVGDNDTVRIRQHN